MPLLATIDRLILRTNICSLFSSLGIVSLIALLELDAASPLLHALGSPLAICEALLISVLVLEAIARVVLAWTQFDGLVLDWLRGAVLSCFGRIQAALSRARDALVAASRNTTVEEDVLEHFAAIVRNAEGRLVATKQQHSNGEPNDAGSSGGGGSGGAKRATMMTLFSSRSHEASAQASVLFMMAKDMRTCFKSPTAEKVLPLRAVELCQSRSFYRVVTKTRDYQCTSCKRYGTVIRYRIVHVLYVIRVL